MQETAQQIWTRLDGARAGLLSRCEHYASVTIPKLCLPDGFDHDTTDQAHDYQSIGAQATNHLTNKIMLALFAPSRPFFRVGTGAQTQQQMAAAGIEEQDMSSILAEMERKAVRELDARGQRPKLYSCIRHLIVTGNVLLILDKELLRVMGIKYYCVKRDARGKVHTLVIKERLKFNELDQDVQDLLSSRYTPDTEVEFYKLIIRDRNGDYLLTQHVDAHLLPEKYNGKWPEDKLPYRVLTWDLADEADYGTGLVEEYIGDLDAASMLSEAVVDGAVMASEIRWLVNPTGVTSVDDVNKSRNGDALAGRVEDVAPTQASNAQAVATVQSLMELYIRRISLAFLMMTGATRDAERVTAEEIRFTAGELETAYGGTYSALANSIQTPVAEWLLELAGASIAGTDLHVSIVTGLDALSRNGDLENLRLAFGDLTALVAATAQDPELQRRIKWKPLTKFVGDGRGVDLTPFIKTDEEVQAEMAQQQEARVAEDAAIAGAQAGVQQGTAQ